MVDLKGGERLERECVCLFNRELVSQPDPILRSWNVGGFCLLSSGFAL